MDTVPEVKPQQSPLKDSRGEARSSGDTNPTTDRRGLAAMSYDEAARSLSPRNTPGSTPVQLKAVQKKPGGPSQVETLQTRLNDLGFDCGEADGLLGPKTREAVVAFQKANGLAVDGIAGPNTLKALGLPTNRGGRPKKKPPQPKVGGGTTPEPDGGGGTTPEPDPEPGGVSGNVLSEKELRFMEFMKAGNTSSAINMAIAANTYERVTVKAILYNPGLGPAGQCAGELGERQTISVGPKGLRYGYWYAVSNLRHELLHAKQRFWHGDWSPAKKEVHEREFLAYASEALNESMPDMYARWSAAGYATIRYEDNLSEDLQEKYLGKYEGCLAVRRLYPETSKAPGHPDSPFPDRTKSTSKKGPTGSTGKKKTEEPEGPKNTPLPPAIRGEVKHRIKNHQMDGTIPHAGVTYSFSYDKGSKIITVTSPGVVPQTVACNPPGMA